MWEPADWQRQIMKADDDVRQQTPIGKDAYQQALYGIEFYYEDDEGVAHGLAQLQALGGLHIPSVGESIRLHDVPVMVKAVNIRYDANESGRFGVWANVVVDYAEGWKDLTFPE